MQMRLSFTAQIPAGEPVEDFDEDQLVRQFVVEPDDDLVMLRESKLPSWIESGQPGAPWTMVSGHGPGGST